MMAMMMIMTIDDVETFAEQWREHAGQDSTPGITSNGSDNETQITDIYTFWKDKYYKIQTQIFLEILDFFLQNADLVPTSGLLAPL